MRQASMPTQILLHNVNDLCLWKAEDEEQTVLQLLSSLFQTALLNGPAGEAWQKQRLDHGSDPFAKQMVELNGIEPMTSSLQSSRSPN